MDGLFSDVDITPYVNAISLFVRTWWPAIFAGWWVLFWLVGLIRKDMFLLAIPTLITVLSLFGVLWTSMSLYTVVNGDAYSITCRDQYDDDFCYEDPYVLREHIVKNENGETNHIMTFESIVAGQMVWNQWCAIFLLFCGFVGHLFYGIAWLCGVRETNTAVKRDIIRVR